MKRNITDEEIGRWSVRKFNTGVWEQIRKLKEETEEMMFELADMWIVICGIKARGTTKKFPTYEEFCKKYSMEPAKLRTIINKKIDIDDKANYTNKNGVLKRMKTAEEIKQIMLELARKNDVIPSFTMDKIANFRASRNIPVSVCPCDQKDKARGCISKKCLKEIQEKGTCHCRAFLKKGVDIKN